MDAENEQETSLDDGAKEASGKFGGVIDALHNKSKLPSLRTYQGDMAEFIKEKNESVISIAVKQKERKEEKKEEEEKFEPLPKSNKKILKANLALIFLSLLLIAGGVSVFLYVFEFIKRGPVNEVVVKTEIIPYNNLITLTNATNKSLGSELGRLSLSGGINIIKISDTSTSDLSFQTTKTFFDFLKISLPGTLRRALQDEYAVGIISQNKESSPFIIIKVDDFGRAFSAMLDWEENMPKDLLFLNILPENDLKTASTTIPMKPEVFSWKDVIVKNKDTRALLNEKGKSKIAYTFLDKNTILITNNISVIGDISSIYASRSVAR